MTRYRPIDWFDWLPTNLYRVGDDGSVWRWCKGDPLRPKSRPPHWRRLTLNPSLNGVTQLFLCHCGHRKQVVLGTLVCRAFHGPRPPGCQAARVGRDPKSYAAKDVQWVPTGKSRIARRSRLANGEPILPTLIAEGDTDSSHTKLDAAIVLAIREMAKANLSSAEIASRFKLDRKTVVRVANGTAWKRISGAIPGWGGHKRGSGLPSAVLTEQDIPRICLLSSQGWKGRDIADQYGVTEAVISRVLNGKSWTHVPRPDTRYVTHSG